MDDSLIQLIELPDEILLTIFKKLDNTQVLYSLFGITERLNQILRDFDFTSHLTLLTQLSSERYSTLSNEPVPLLEDVVLDRFCSRILPDIHDKIQWLDVDSLSMERILLIVDYSKLSGLGLYNLEDKRATRIFNGMRFY
jgi:hypothetical protein